MNTHFLMMAVDSYIGMKLAVENTFILSGNLVRRYEPSYFEQHKCSQNKTNIHTHTHPHLPVIASKRGQFSMDPPTEDTRFLIHHYSTVDIMWLFTTQPRTSSYTPNRGHGLNSIFTSFPSSCSPREPRTVHGVECVLGLLWNFRYVSSFGGFYILLLSYTYPYPHIKDSSKISA